MRRIRSDNKQVSRRYLHRECGDRRVNGIRHTAHTPPRTVLRAATSVRPSRRGIITKEPRSLLLLLVLFDFFRRQRLFGIEP